MGLAADLPLGSDGSYREVGPFFFDAAILGVGLVELILVAAGGALGALARYGLAAWVAGRTGSGFPWGTLVVNVLGCLAIGFAYALVARHADWAPVLRAGVIVGLIGGFTTFSTFNYEALNLLGSRPTWGLLYLAASLGAGLAATWVGLHLPGGLPASARDIAQAAANPAD